MCYHSVAVQRECPLSVALNFAGPPNLPCGKLTIVFDAISTLKREKRKVEMARALKSDLSCGSGSEAC